MLPPYKPGAPKGTSEIMGLLGMVMLASPTFLDQTGYFADRKVETIFHSLNEGLRLIRAELGEERYLKLIEMADRMRVHFEADPEDKTDDTLKKRAIILEMEAFLKQKARKP
jgi:hypothetical protein